MQAMLLTGVAELILPTNLIIIIFVCWENHVNITGEVETPPHTHHFFYPPPPPPGLTSSGYRDEVSLCSQTKKLFQVHSIQPFSFSLPCLFRPVLSIFTSLSFSFVSLYLFLSLLIALFVTLSNSYSFSPPPPPPFFLPDFPFQYVLDWCSVSKQDRHLALNLPLHHHHSQKIQALCLSRLLLQHLCLLTVWDF